MTADEPMSTPDSGGLREAVEALADEMDNPDRHGRTHTWSPSAATAIRAALAAHPEPVPTPPDSEAGEAAMDALAELVALKNGPRDSDYERRKPLAWQVAQHVIDAYRPTPNSADEATVGEREGCGAVSLDEDWVPGVWEAHDHLCVTHARDEHECACGARWDATPPADDANRAPVSGGLDEGEREHVAGLILRECRHEGRTGRDWCCADCHNLRGRVLATRDAAWAERLASVEGDRDEVAGRLSELLCELTDGLMSKTGYSVRTMVQAVEAVFEKHAISHRPR